MLKQSEKLKIYNNYYLLNIFQISDFKSLKYNIINKIDLIYLNKKNKKINFIINELNQLKLNSLAKKSNNLKNLIEFYFTKSKRIYIKKKFKFIKLFNNINLNKQNNTLNILPENLPFLDLLKSNKVITLNLKNIINSFGYIYIKFSGINTFITLTNNKGNVFILFQGVSSKMLKK